MAARPKRTRSKPSAKSGALRLVLGDQLTRRVSSLTDLDPERDVVLMAEVMAEATYVRHHKQKIAFLFSAMRHFAEDLRREGVEIVYVRLDDPANTGSLAGEVGRAVDRLRPERIVLTEPGEWRLWDAMRRWSVDFGLPVEIRDDNRFLCSRAEFARWAEGRKTYRMEIFYREMRRKTGLLMDGDEPEGGQWNFDHDNRKPIPSDVAAPDLPRFKPDATTEEVLGLVADRFGEHFGSLDTFGWAVTRRGALKALKHFVEHRLERFGDYQDAMRGQDDFLFHSALSPYINAGLLLVEEVVQAAERAFRDGLAPLNAVEGFVRQIIGWREYMRGIYWTRMPDYARTNALGASRPLPWFYWSGETGMACLADCIRSTAEHAYAHHIQRLMVTGNFALIAGIAPAEVEEWYLVVYADAYEWVELPNVHGMILWADGGVLGSKPYAASGAYIDRMSDYCGGCRYDVGRKSGPDACPFNYLYWDFHIRNERRLAANPRLRNTYATLGRMKPARRTEIVADAERFFASPEMSPEPPASGEAAAAPAQGRLL